MHIQYINHMSQSLVRSDNYFSDPGSSLYSHDDSLHSNLVVTSHLFTAATSGLYTYTKKHWLRMQKRL